VETFETGLERSDRRPGCTGAARAAVRERRAGSAPAIRWPMPAPRRCGRMPLSAHCACRGRRCDAGRGPGTRRGQAQRSRYAPGRRPPGLVSA